MEAHRRVLVLTIFDITEMGFPHEVGKHTGLMMIYIKPEV
jgi:hypothetical protein